MVDNSGGLQFISPAVMTTSSNISVQRDLAGSNIIRMDVPDQEPTVVPPIPLSDNNRPAPQKGCDH